MATPAAVLPSPPAEPASTPSKHGAGGGSSHRQKHRPLVSPGTPRSPRALKGLSTGGVAGHKSVLNRVQVTLSRPVYRPGTPIVGTIRLDDEADVMALSQSLLFTNSPSTKQQQQQQQVLASSSIASLSLFVVGFCRLDSRWHKNTTYREAYPHRIYEKDNPGLGEALRSLPLEFPDRRSIFWTSFVAATQKSWIDLVRGSRLQQYHHHHLKDSDSCTAVPSWEDMKPQPVRYTEDWADRPDPPAFEDSATLFSSSSPLDLSLLDQNRHQNHHHDVGRGRRYPCLAFTFRADLPATLPSTLTTAVSCRYSYAVVLRLKSQSGAVSWLETPVTVQKCPSAPSPMHKSLPLHSLTSTLSVQSITGSLPCTLTATELYGASQNYQKGSLTVHHFSASFHVHSAPGPVLRVTDPYLQRPVAILTVIAPVQIGSEEDGGGGSGASSYIALYPGSRLYLQLDFPSKAVSLHGKADEWVPCCQVSACLQGEENVLTLDDTISPETGSNANANAEEVTSTETITTIKEKKQRAQQLLLFTAHEVIDPETTERVSLTLLVPDSAMCNVKTPPLEVKYDCLVDIVVSNPATTKTTTTTTTTVTTPQLKYRNLRLQLPCHIMHAPTALETMTDLGVDPEEEALLKRQEQLWKLRRRRTSHNNNNNTSHSHSMHNRATTNCAPSIEPMITTTTKEDDDKPNIMMEETFRTDDILDDLKRLSIFMAEENGWTLEAAPFMGAH